MSYPIGCNERNTSSLFDIPGTDALLESNMRAYQTPIERQSTKLLAYKLQNCQGHESQGKTEELRTKETKVT